jgi:hypothetical protein
MKHDGLMASDVIIPSLRHYSCCHAKADKTAGKLSRDADAFSIETRSMISILFSTAVLIDQLPLPRRFSPHIYR